MLDALNSFGNFAQNALEFYSDPIKFFPDMAYGFPKMVFKATVSVTYMGAEKIYDVASNFFEKTPPPKPPEVTRISIIRDSFIETGSWTTDKILNTINITSSQTTGKNITELIQPITNFMEKLKDTALASDAGQEAKNLYQNLKTLYSFTSKFGSLFYPEVTPEYIQGDPSKLSIALKPLTEKIDEFSVKATHWVIKKTADELEENLEAYTALGNFKAFDLIGPSLAFGFYTNKALTNFSSAMQHAKLLVTNQRLLSTAYQSPSLSSRAVAIVEKTRRYTAARLLKDTAMESIFAALWSTGSYFTYQGIYKSVLQASNNNSAQASYIANMILTVGIVAPSLYAWVEDAYYTSDTQYKSSKMAPYLVYSDPKENENDPKEINKAKKLSHEEKLEFLKKYRKISLTNE